jgi:hypothetical protein
VIARNRTRYAVRIGSIALIDDLEFAQRFQEPTCVGSVGVPLVVRREHVTDDDVSLRWRQLRRRSPIWSSRAVRWNFLGHAVHREVALQLRAKGWTYKASWGPDFTHTRTGVRMELTTSNPAIYVAHNPRYNGKALVLPYDPPK